MPIQRYRDVADMPDPPRKSSALEGLRAACEASELAAAIGTTRVLPRGVKKFRSIEAMAADREAWETGTHEAPAPDPDSGD